MLVDPARGSARQPTHSAQRQEAAGGGRADGGEPAEIHQRQGVGDPITRGAETRDADPCALASELEKTCVNFVNVVAFGLSVGEDAKVKCPPDNTADTTFRPRMPTATRPQSTWRSTTPRPPWPRRPSMCFLTPGSSRSARLPPATIEVFAAENGHPGKPGGVRQHL